MFSGGKYGQITFVGTFFTCAIIARLRTDPYFFVQWRIIEHFGVVKKYDYNCSLKILKLQQGMVAQTWNPSYFGSSDWQDHIPRLAMAKGIKTPSTSLSHWFQIRKRS
jgi:hypothetical protein